MQEFIQFLMDPESRIIVYSMIGGCVVVPLLIIGVTKLVDKEFNRRLSLLKSFCKKHSFKFIDNRGTNPQSRELNFEKQYLKYPIPIFHGKNESINFMFGAQKRIGRTIKVTILDFGIVDNKNYLTGNPGLIVFYSGILIEATEGSMGFCLDGFTNLNKLVQHSGPNYFFCYLEGRGRWASKSELTKLWNGCEMMISSKLKNVS